MRRDKAKVKEAIEREKAAAKRKQSAERRERLEREQKRQREQQREQQRQKKLELAAHEAHRTAAKKAIMSGGGSTVGKWVSEIVLLFRDNQPVRAEDIHRLSSNIRDTTTKIAHDRGLTTEEMRSVFDETAFHETVEKQAIRNASERLQQHLKRITQRPSEWIDECIDKPLEWTARNREQLRDVTVHVLVVPGWSSGTDTEVIRDVMIKLQPDRLVFCACKYDIIFKF